MAELKNRQANTKQNILGYVSAVFWLSSKRPSWKCPVIPNPCCVPFEIRTWGRSLAMFCQPISQLNINLFFAIPNQRFPFIWLLCTLNLELMCLHFTGKLCSRRFWALQTSQCDLPLPAQEGTWCCFCLVLVNKFTSGPAFSLLSTTCGFWMKHSILKAEFYRLRESTTI